MPSPSRVSNRSALAWPAPQADGVPNKQTKQIKMSTIWLNSNWLSIGRALSEYKER
jgi:hypothetical protein